MIFNRTDDVNQTKFASQEPLLEAAEKLPEPKLAAEKTNKLFWRSRLGIMILLAGVLTLVAVLLLLIILRKEQPKIKPPASELEEEQLDETDPWFKRVKQLQTQLKEADPAKQSLTFPPVDLEIKLDD